MDTNVSLIFRRTHTFACLLSQVWKTFPHSLSLDLLCQEWDDGVVGVPGAFGSDISWPAPSQVGGDCALIKIPF